MTFWQAYWMFARSTLICLLFAAGLISIGFGLGELINEHHYILASIGIVLIVAVAIGIAAWHTARSDEDWRGK